MDHVARDAYDGLRRPDPLGAHTNSTLGLMTRSGEHLQVRRTELRLALKHSFAISVVRAEERSHRIRLTLRCLNS